MRLFRTLSRELHATYSSFRNEGLGPAAARLAGIAGRIFIIPRHELFVLAKPLPDTAPAVEPPAGLQIIELTDGGKIEEMGLLAPDLGDVVRFRLMFRRGSHVFLAQTESEIAGWGWVSDKVNWRINPTHPPLQPGNVCLHDVFVVPECRGHHLARSIASHRLRFAQEHGYRRPVIATSDVEVSTI